MYTVDYLVKPARAPGGRAGPLAAPRRRLDRGPRTVPRAAWPLVRDPRALVRATWCAIRGPVAACPGPWPPGRAPRCLVRPPPAPGPEKRAGSLVSRALALFYTVGFT
jgi:hypothetical protein